MIESKKNFAFFIGIAIALAVLGNLVSREVFFRLDLTENRIYSLSSSSRTMLEKVDDLLTAKVYFSENLPGEYGNTRRYLQDILEEYAAYSDGDFRFEFYMPDDDEKLALEAQKSGIQPVQLQVVENDKLEIKRVYMGMALLYGDKREVLPIIQTNTGLEYEITTRIKKLVDENRAVVGIANVGDSAPAMERISMHLRDAYEVRSVYLSAGVPADIEMLLVNGVSDSLAEDALGALKSYIARGGNLFLAQGKIDGDLQAQRGMPIKSNIFDVLEPFGVNLADNLVMDRVCGTITVSQQRGFLRFNSAVEYPFFPVLQTFPDHEIVSGLEQVQMLFSSEIIYDSADSTRLVAPLLVTSDHSSAAAGFINLNPIQNQAFQSLNEPGKVVGVYATAVSDSLENVMSQLVLVSTSDFLLDSGGGQVPSNGIFVMNAVDVLIGDRDLVALRSREITTRPLQTLDDATRTTLKTINIVLPALLVIGYGLFQWRLEAVRAKRLEALYE